MIVYRNHFFFFFVVITYVPILNALGLIALLISGSDLRKRDFILFKGY